MKVDTENSYLIGRTQFTVINSSSGPVWSDGRSITSGVPQGSILGPLLFSLYISDIENCMQHCSVQLFADDIQIYLSFPPKDAPAAEMLINEDLANIHSWTISNFLVLNPNKCQHMLTGSRHSLSIVNDLDVFVDNVRISSSESVVSLGVVIDRELNLTNNVSRLCKKAYYSWKQLLPFRDVLDAPTKLLLTESLVLSLLNYGDIVYGPFISCADNYRLQKVQNLCIRFVTRIPPFSHVTPYLREFRCLKVQERRFLHYAVFVSRVVSSRCPPYLFNKLSKRSEAHQRALRHIDSTLTIPIHSTEFFKQGFSYLATSVFNNFLSKFSSLEPKYLKICIKNMVLENHPDLINIRMF